MDAPNSEGSFEKKYQVRDENDSKTITMIGPDGYEIVPVFPPLAVAGVHRHDAFDCTEATSGHGLEVPQFGKCKLRAQLERCVCISKFY